jgi:hypothetical protein
LKDKGRRGQKSAGDSDVLALIAVMARQHLGGAGHPAAAQPQPPRGRTQAPRPRHSAGSDRTAIEAVAQRLIRDRAKFPGGRFNSLFSRFNSLFGRINSLFAQLGNSPSNSMQNNGLQASIASSIGPKSGFTLHIPAEHGNGRLSTRRPGRSAAPG